MLLIEQCSAGQPIGALAIICLWVLLTWLIYAYGILCHDDVVPGEFLLVQCASQLFFLNWAYQLMYVYDQLLDRYIITSR